MHTLNVVATVAMKGVLEHIGPGFLASNGRQLGTTYGPGGVALRHLQSGHPGDVIILGSDTIEQFAEKDLVVPHSRQTVARSIIGVAVKQGASKPRLATVEDFEVMLRNAASVAYTDPRTGAASGVHVAGLLERFGMREMVDAKAKFGDGGPVARFVASGEAELAIQQICEHLLVDGVEIVGPLPGELQKVTIMEAALLTGATDFEAGEALIRLLAAADTQRIMPKHGLEPALRHERELPIFTRG